MKKALLPMILASIFCVGGVSAEFITIGTGVVTGVYYPTGGAVCQLVNKMKKETGVRCSVESTDGAVYNINAIRNGELDFGMAQSDVIYYALRGEKNFKDKPYPELRAVMGIYPELLALVVSKSSNIRSLQDLKGKRINIDVPDSGTRLTTELVMKTEGVKLSDLSHKSEFRAIEGPKLLEEQKVDGYFGMFGHPTAHIKETASAIRADLVPIQGRKINSLIAKYPYYTKSIISGTFYKGITHDTPSIGVKAVLVTSDKVSEKTVYTLVKAVVDNFDEFKKLHPVYKTITKESLLDGIVAPLHKGAKEYFKEAGIIK